MHSQNTEDLDDREHGDTEAAAPDEEGAPEGPPRGADEIDFLGSREKTTALSEVLARERSNQIARRAEHWDAIQAAEDHEQGELLNDFYMRHGDAVLARAESRADTALAPLRRGRRKKTFARWLDSQWPLSGSVARKRMRIGRVFTRAEVNEWKSTKCDFALRLIKALGLVEKAAERFPDEKDDRGSLSRRALEILLNTTLHLREEDGGGTTRFPAPVRELSAALDYLREEKKRAKAGADDEPAGRRLLRHRAAIAEMEAEDADVAALGTRASLDAAKKVSYSMRIVGKSGIAAAQRLLERLEQLR